MFFSTIVYRHVYQTQMTRYPTNPDHLGWPTSHVSAPSTVLPWLVRLYRGGDTHHELRIPNQPSKMDEHEMATNLFIRQLLNKSMFFFTQHHIIHKMTWTDQSTALLSFPGRPASLHHWNAWRLACKAKRCDFFFRRGNCQNLIKITNDFRWF